MSYELPNAYVLPELYARILLGQTWSPGVVTLSGHDRNENWNVVSAKGSEGASTKLEGRNPGEFQASFYIADAQDEADWEAFQQLIDSTTSGPTPVALPVFHPDLAANGFTAVVKDSVGGKVRDARGGITVLVKFREYFPPKPKPPARAKAKPDQKRAGDGGRATKPDPNADAKRELEQLTELAKQP